jgi:hypothetical protein
MIWRHNRNSCIFLYMTNYWKNATCHHCKLFYKKSKNGSDPIFSPNNLKNISDKMVLFLLLYKIYISYTSEFFRVVKMWNFDFFLLRLLQYISLFNPEHGGLPESTAVAGWVGATPTPVTLLQINSRVQKVACRCSRGFPIMPNLFRKIIVYPLSVGDRWTWPSQTCHKIRDKNMT